MDDSQLLSQFVSTRSPEAFAALVRAHAGMVYSAARRQMGQADLAEDVTQAVFILLARKAVGIQPAPLVGWLLRATHFACRDARKLLARRQYHERRAAEMKPEEIPVPQDPAWESDAPMLDDALADLGKKDHDAVALRFFRGLNLRDVGIALGISEDAARKRVNRGIVRLRHAMAARTAAPAVAVLTMQLAARGSEAAPAHLLQSIAATAATATAKGTFAGAIARKASHTMTWVKIKFAAAIIAAVSIVGAGTGALLTLAQDHETPMPSPKAVAVSQTASAASAELPKSTSRPDTPAVNLVKALAQYRLFHTIHCKADETYNDPARGISDGAATCEYWSDGEKYRILENSDFLKMPGMSNDVRWDGKRFQRLDIQNSALWTSMSSAHHLLFVSEPAPLIPFTFLDSGSENGYLRPTLDSLRSDQTRKRMDDAHIQSSDGLEAEFPGGKIFGLDYVYHMKFGTFPAFLPAEITRVLSNGVVAGETEITYQPVPCRAGVIFLPKTIKIVGRNEANEITALGTYTVTLIELDKPIPSETFAPMDPRKARTIIDMDHVGASGSSVRSTQPTASTRGAD